MADPTRPDLLERFRALGTAMRKFETRFSLPTQFISLLKAGKYSSGTAISDALFARFEAALAVCESERGTPPPTLAPGQIKQRHTNQVLAPEVEGEITKLMEGADTLEKWESLQRRVMVLRMKGLAQETFLRSFNESLNIFRQTQKEKRAVAAENPSDDPVTIIIEYVNLKAVT